MQPVASCCHPVERLEALSRASTWTVLACACLALSAFDRAVPEIGTGPLYIPLIALAGWRLGAREACAVALLAALLNIFPHHVDEEVLRPAIAAARGVTRLSAYAFVVGAVCALRRAYDRERTAARHDALTGVLNRAAFETHARAVLQDPSAASRVRALALVDIDGFKAVNDTDGHAAGEEALRTFAAVATSALAPGERLGRLGGDEFVLLLEADTVEAVRHRAATVHCRLSDRLQRTGHTLGVSMGAVILPPGANADWVATLRRADALMYAAKAAGKGRLRYETSGGIVRPGSTVPTPAVVPAAA